MKHLLPKKQSNFELKILLNDEIIEKKKRLPNLFNEAFNNVQSEILGTDGTPIFNINALNTLHQTENVFKFTLILMNHLY